MIKQFTYQIFAFFVLLAPLATSAKEGTPVDGGAENTLPIKMNPRPTALQHFAESFDNPLWLQTPDDEKVFSLYTPDHSGQPRGALLILHRGEEPPWWSEQLEYLRTTLPDYGWATLLVVLPTEKIEIAKRPAAVKAEVETAAAETESSENADETDKAGAGEDKEIFDSSSGDLATTSEMNQTEAATPEAEIETKPPLPLRERTEQRLMAAMHFLHKKNQFHLALLSDSSITPLSSDVLRRMPAGGTGNNLAIQAQISLNFYRDHPQSRDEITEGFFNTAVPLLDIYLDGGKHSNPNNQERKRHAKRLQYQSFRQININSHDREILAKRVRGFLTRHADGTAKNAR